MEAANRNFSSFVYSVIDVLAQSFFPLEPERNPYTAIYVPLARRSSALRNAILVASANHLVSLGQFHLGP